MDFGDVASAVSALIAALAAAVAYRQLRVFQRDALEARAAEIGGVAIETAILRNPRGEDVADGTARWQYEFTIHNPGRLPISDVRAIVKFPVPVQREHYDGSLDPANPEVEIYVPVIPANSASVSRRRTLRISEEARGQLSGTTSSVTFLTSDLGRVTCDWPPTPTGHDRAKRLAEYVRAAGVRVTSA
ncbi:hypothetical protein [Cryptosporangium japonicum]|uniref:Uncharacterized protein n=1 Tax=Cryptosporangium japonicum TaxID=80872 RepID=A0ABP3EUQ5_9ACTN